MYGAHTHKWFTAEQVQVLLKGYCQGMLDRPSVEKILGISKTRFFALLRQYRHHADKFSLAYQRATPSRLPASVEKEIEAELMLEKGLIEDPSLPISGYNYSASRDCLAKRGVIVSSPTIIARAKDFGCYQPHPRKKAHNREVLHWKDYCHRCLNSTRCFSSPLVTLCQREMGFNYFPG